MTRVAILVCAVLGVMSRPARAGDDTEAIRKVVLAQVKAIGAGSGPAFAKTVAAKDVFGMVVGTYATTGAQIGAGTSRAWPKGSNAATLKKLIAGSQGDVAWATAEIELAPRNPDFATGTYRATELLAREGGSWKVHAILISGGTQDMPEMWAGGTWEKSDKPPGTMAKQGAPLADWVVHPAQLGAHLHAGDSVSVIGAATERGDGAAAATALAKWNDPLTAAWTRAGGDGKTYAWLAARVERQVKVGTGMIAEPYWVFAMAVKGAKDWELVSVQYSQIASF